MLVRKCAGGVVFYGDKVFLIQNDKNEWSFPKGKIDPENIPAQTAVIKVKEEAGIEADIISTAGRTSYEFFSYNRKKPVCNKITWYIMKVLNPDFILNNNDEFVNGGYFDIAEAMTLITYSQDKSLLNVSFKKMKELFSES